MSATNRILITGASGMLGKDIARLLTATADVQTFGIVRSLQQPCSTHEARECDLTDSKKLKNAVEEINPVIIIHCAAVVNLDECEKNHALADAVHVEATDILSQFNAGRTRFIYISTDSVFNGEGGPYREEDPTDPVNYYALSKRNGEYVALQNNANAVVLRTNIYGFHIPFGKSLGEWAIDSLSSGKSINGFSDVYFNPLYTKQIANLIAQWFLQNDTFGIWHLGPQIPLSKYEFLKMVSEHFGFDSSLVIPSSIEGIKFSTPRPKSTILDVTKLHRIIHSQLTIEDGLNAYYNDYKMNFPE